jgi:hypothetical protein
MEDKFPFYIEQTPYFAPEEGEVGSQKEDR